jgi:hypothetical protein
MTPTVLPDLTDVRALTLHRPWATAITRCGKDVENRSWMPWRGTRRILIHAGKAWDPVGAARLIRCGYTGPVDTSAIVAVADVVGACDKAVHGQPCHCGPWAAAGQCHWLLGTVWTLAEPVPCRGRQALWLPDLDLLRQVRAAGVAQVRTPRALTKETQG